MSGRVRAPPCRGCRKQRERFALARRADAVPPAACRAASRTWLSRTTRPRPSRPGCRPPSPPLPASPPHPLAPRPARRLRPEGRCCAGAPCCRQGSGQVRRRRRCRRSAWPCSQRRPASTAAAPDPPPGCRQRAAPAQASGPGRRKGRRRPSRRWRFEPSARRRLARDRGCARGASDPASQGGRAWPVRCRGHPPRGGRRIAACPAGNTSTRVS